MGVVEVETTLPPASKKLKIKILAKKPLTSPCDLPKQWPLKNCVNKSGSNDDEKATFASNAKLNCSTMGSKRKLEATTECFKAKKLKLDYSATSKCHLILRRLMKHKYGYIFSEPVDPVKLGIPDYFDVIRTPMDLGTIKRKLDQTIYKEVEDFESDVKLTFSNAMRYNPPDNWVHVAAKGLMTMFFNLLKQVKSTQKGKELEGSKHLSSEKSINKTTLDNKRKSVESLFSNGDKLRRQAKLSVYKAPESLKNVSLEKVQLKNMKVAKDWKAEGIESSKACTMEPAFGGLPRLCEESACTVSAQPQTLHIRPAESAGKVKPENAAFGNRVLHDELKAVDVKFTSASQLSRPDPESDGCVSCLDEDYVCTNSLAATTRDLDTVLDIQLSPSKALRAARLKSRFADTILKAQQKTLLQPVTDPMKLKQEKEKLERIQHKEKEMIEAKIRAAQSAARCKAEMEHKRQRERDRESARIALEKMERSVDLDDNFHILRDLEKILGNSPWYLSSKCQDGISCAAFNQFENGKLRSPLERLGLFIKAEYMVGDDDEDAFPQAGDWEEGEVVF